MTAPTSRADFEVIYVVDPLSDELEDAICETQDATIAYHSRLCLVTLTTFGNDGVHAGVNGVATLASYGVRVLRSYPDLVTRSDIAERADVSTQAVGMWIRGERQIDSEFPQPAHLVGSGAWLWVDVNAWLTSTGKAGGDMRFPSLADHAAIDVAIAEAAVLPAALSVVWGHGSFSSLRVKVASGTAAPHPQPWVSKSGRREFAMVRPS